MQLILRCHSLVLAFIFCFYQTAAAADSAQPKRVSKGQVSNYDVFNQGRHKRDATITHMQSEMALRISDVNRAIRLGRRAVELNPDDIEARTALAEALYQKVKHGKTDDPGVFNECVKTWLMILRNVVGEEKGLTYKGIGIPLIQKFYEDEDHGTLAKERLTALCGRTPKAWETNKKFLDKVLRPETSVAGEIVRRSNYGSADREANEFSNEHRPIGAANQTK